MPLYYVPESKSVSWTRCFCCCCCRSLSPFLCVVKWLVLRVFTNGIENERGAEWVSVHVKYRFIVPSSNTSQYTYRRWYHATTIADCDTQFIYIHTFVCSLGWTELEYSVETHPFSFIGSFIHSERWLSWHQFDGNSITNCLDFLTFQINIKSIIRISFFVGKKKNSRGKFHFFLWMYFSIILFGNPQSN